MSNSVDPDETAHYEPSHLDLRCLQKPIITACGSERVNLDQAKINGPRNLIRVFIVYIFHSQNARFLHAENEDSNQADLNFRRAHMSDGTFSHVWAQMSFRVAGSNVYSGSGLQRYSRSPIRTFAFRLQDHEYSRTSTARISLGPKKWSRFCLC